MNIVILGGLGYIGSHLTKRLINLGHDVVVIDKNHNHLVASLIGLDVGIGKFIHADLDEVPPQALAARVRETQHGTDTIIHLAECIERDVELESLQETGEIPHEAKGARVRATRALTLMHELGAKRFIYGSAASVYGGHNRTLSKEDDFTNPHSLYGLSKLNVEQTLEDFQEQMDFQLTILRYGNPVGCKFGLTYGLLGDQSSLGANMIAFVRGSQTRFYLDVSAVSGLEPARSFIGITRFITANIKVIEDKSLAQGVEIFNIGGGCATPRMLLHSYLSRLGVRAKNDLIIKRELTLHRPSYSAIDSTHFEQRYGMSLYCSMEELVETIR